MLDIKKNKKVVKNVFSEQQSVKSFHSVWLNLYFNSLCPSDARWWHKSE